MQESKRPATEKNITNSFYRSTREPVFLLSYGPHTLFPLIQRLIRVRLNLRAKMLLSSECNMLKTWLYIKVFKKHGSYIIRWVWQPDFHIYIYCMLK